ncbi:MAG: DUF4043 family protein [Calditrichaeota bacterium]|nr:DUF4043 family protein [Calditrichota bacterium]
MAVLDRSFTGNQPVILAQKMMFQAQQYHFWGRFAKFNTPDGKAVNPNGNTMPRAVENSPVVIQRELQRKMGDFIQVPMHRLLTQSATYGLTQMKDREERQKINHARVAIDIVRHAVEPQEGIMSTQTSKDYNLIQNARPALMRHYAETCNYEGASWAFYNGYSKNVLDSSRFTGNSQNISANSHPNCYAAGQGKVGETPGSAAYETAIGTAISAMGSSDVLDTNLLQALSADETIRFIRPLMSKDGNPYRILVVHPYQLYNLKNDSNFREVTSRADAQAFAKENPLLTGCKFFWDGWAIFDGAQAVFPAAVSSGDVVWGPNAGTITDLTTFRSYSSNNIFGAMVLGDNALFKAIGQNMEFKKRMADYDEIVGIAYRVVEGYSRGDFWNEDDGTRGASLVNEGSAVVLTYAAKPTL